MSNHGTTPIVIARDIGVRLGVGILSDSRRHFHRMSTLLLGRLDGSISFLGHTRHRWLQGGNPRLGHHRRLGRQRRSLLLLLYFLLLSKCAKQDYNHKYYQKIYFRIHNQPKARVGISKSKITNKTRIGKEVLQKSFQDYVSAEAACSESGN